MYLRCGSKQNKQKAPPLTGTLDKVKGENWIKELLLFLADTLCGGYMDKCVLIG